MKYIPAEKLIAEIERWRDKAKEKYNVNPYSMGRCDALAEFRNHIVSLQQEMELPEKYQTPDWLFEEQQQPEVDLEKEIIRYQREDMDRDTTVADVARHFYELGRARK